MVLVANIVTFFAWRERDPLLYRSVVRHLRSASALLILSALGCGKQTQLEEQSQAQNAPAPMEAILRTGAKIYVLDGKRGAIVPHPQGALIEAVPWDSTQSPYVRIVLQIVDQMGRGWAMVGWNPPSFVDVADVEDLRKASDAEREYVEFPFHGCPTFTIDQTTRRFVMGPVAKDGVTVPVSVAGIDEFKAYRDSNPYVPILDREGDGVFVPSKCIDLGIDIEPRLIVSSNGRYVVREPMNADKFRVHLKAMAARSREFGRCDYIAGVIPESGIGTAPLTDGTALRTLPVREVAPQQDVQGTGLDNVPRWYRIPELDLLPPKPIEGSDDFFYVLCQDENGVTSFTDLGTEAEFDWLKATGLRTDTNRFVWAGSPLVHVYNMSSVNDGPGFWSTTRPQPVHTWGPPIYVSEVSPRRGRYVPTELTLNEDLNHQMWRREMVWQDLHATASIIRYVKTDTDPLGVFDDMLVAIGAYEYVDGSRPIPSYVVIGASQAATFELGGWIYFDGPNYFGFTGNPAMETDPIGLYDVHAVIHAVNSPPPF